MRPRKRGFRVSDLGAGLIALLILVPLLYLGFTKSIPFRHHFEIKAAFRTANNVKSGSPVRIAGVNVGKVSGVDHLPGGGDGALVTMRIDTRGTPLHTDATARVRPRIFLEGNFFVDLSPGSPSTPVLHDGGTIPIQQTAAPVQLDQILTSLQSGTRRNLQILLDEYGTAVRGGGAGYNRSIPYWKDAYLYGAQLNRAQLGLAPHDLSNYIDSSGAVAGALDLHPAQLKALLRDFNQTAGAFARADGALSATLVELPRTLEVGRPSLLALDRSLPPLRRLARELDPGVRSTGPMIDASLPFVRQLRGLVQPAELRGLVADLRPTIPSLARLQSRSLALYPQVRLASSCQNDVILPWSHLTVPDEHFPPKRQVYIEATKFLPGIVNESTSGDANGQWFRVQSGGGANVYGLGPNLVGQSLFPVQGLEPTKPTVRPQIRPHVPCETQQVPDLRASSSMPPPRSASLLSTKSSRERFDKARARATTWLRSALKAEHSPLKVSNRPATLSDINREARNRGTAP